MYELKVTATKVLGECTANPPVEKGDTFTVRDGDITTPEGGFICLWALQNMLPVLTTKERDIAEEKNEDWMWRVHHVQCPDPAGRVIYKIERVRKLQKGDGNVPNRDGNQHRQITADATGKASKAPAGKGGESHGLRDLRIIVDEVKGKCTSGMAPGDWFDLCEGRLYIPPNKHFCLYAMQSVIPFLAAKQRPMEDGDWLERDSCMICPDPAGNVVMRIERSDSFSSP